MRYFIFSLLLVSSAVSASQLYQWVDEEGVTHYTQTPPPSYVNAEQRTLQEPKPKPEATEVEEPQEQDALAALKAARAENCKMARENLQKLTSDQELVALATGNETPEEMAAMKPMTIEERQADIEKYRNFETEFCQNVPVEESTDTENETEQEE